MIRIGIDLHHSLDSVLQRAANLCSYTAERTFLCIVQ